MKQAERWLCLVLAFLFCYLTVPFATEAAGTPVPDLSGALAVCCYHIGSGKMLGEVTRNENVQVPAGATPKVMAGLLACELLADRLGERITVTKAMLASSRGRQSPVLKAVTETRPVTVTVEQLLYLALCGSYNDAYDVLAAVAAGSAEAFVSRMNARAREVGAQQTVYLDVCGVGDNSLTTAGDQLLIAGAAAENDLYLRCCSAERCELFNSEVYDFTVIYNYNALISQSVETGYLNSDCIGMSAGTTDAGGNSVVTLARRGNDSYLCVVLGGKTENRILYSYVVANRVLRWAFLNYAYREVLSEGTLVCSIPVTVSDIRDEVEVRTAGSLSFFLPADAVVGTDVTYSLRLMYDSIEAPVEEGMLVGYVAVRYNGRTLGTVPLHTAESIGRSSIVSGLNGIKSLTKNRGVRAGIVFFAVSVTVWIAAELFARRRRRRTYERFRSLRTFDPERDRRPDYRR